MANPHGYRVATEHAHPPEGVVAIPEALTPQGNV